MKRIARVTLVSAGFLAFAFLALRIFVADVSYNLAQDYLADRDYSKAQEFSQRAISLSPHEPRYLYGEAKVLLAQLPDTDKHEILGLLVNAENLNPENLVTLRNVAPFYYFLAIGDLQQAESPENIDAEFLSTTQEFFERLSAEYPQDVGVQVLVAKYEKRLGLIGLYEDKIEKIRNLRPDLLEWHPDIN